ncbi:hypothetical protein SAMN05421505_16223 [Sinosporangium album]|uniref:Metallothionein n=1 Tax=Sinosporangium album TaxID=504805 RepID=A0A1G8L7J9_9ACTN|nr:hypothetical protein SAMN05421505_16223 [Sinosporangium album]
MPDNECILCGAPGGHPYCSESCRRAQGECCLCGAPNGYPFCGDACRAAASDD